MQATAASREVHGAPAQQDTIVVKELVKRWFPRVYYNAPAKHGGHRALADILESIRELGLSSRNDLGHIAVVAQGQTLADRALQRFPQTVRPA